MRTWIWVQVKRFKHRPKLWNKEGLMDKYMGKRIQVDANPFGTGGGNIRYAQKGTGWLYKREHLILTEI
jgi:hypothetical protein